MSPPSPVAHDRYPYRVLDPRQREATAAIARVMLKGALPTQSAARADAVVQAVRGVDTAVAGLPPSVQSEIAQLYALLLFPLTRVLAAGISTDWSEATDAQIESFLTRWRFSDVTLLRSGYDALHQLTMAGWYGQNSAWPRIGYDGPPKLS